VAVWQRREEIVFALIKGVEGPPRSRCAWKSPREVGLAAAVVGGLVPGWWQPADRVRASRIQPD